MGSWGYRLGDGFVSGFETEEAARRHYGFRCTERAGDVVFMPTDDAIAAAVKAERERIAALLDALDLNAEHNDGGGPFVHASDVSALVASLRGAP